MYGRNSDRTIHAYPACHEKNLEDCLLIGLIRNHLHEKMRSNAKSIVRFIVCLSYLTSIARSFSGIGMKGDSKGIYNVFNSGWQSAAWNWGSAIGTGHDCARICRQVYASREARELLISNLFQSSTIPADFEEVKLVLALSWQRGRRDGSDGGRGGYGEVLELMVEAIRYEEGSEEECSMRLVQDMQARYDLLRPTLDQCAAMQRLMEDCASDVYLARRRCSGLVLEAMRFIENGC